LTQQPCLTEKLKGFRAIHSIFRISYCEAVERKLKMRLGCAVVMGTRLFGLVVSVSRHFGQTMKSCRDLTCSLFDANALKSTKGFIYKNYKQDSRSNS